MTRPEDITSLLRKYERIRDLRQVAAAHPEQDPRREMAELASEFPGSLREADELPMEELERRVLALRRVESGFEGAAAWMSAMIRFHALTRGALCAKKWLRGRKSVDSSTRAAFEVEADGLCFADDARAWVADLERVANPPRGRVTELVFEKMAGEGGIDVEAARLSIFGERSRAR